MLGIVHFVRFRYGALAYSTRARCYQSVEHLVKIISQGQERRSGAPKHTNLKSNDNKHAPAVGRDKELPPAKALGDSLLFSNAGQNFVHPMSKLIQTLYLKVDFFPSYSAWTSVVNSPPRTQTRDSKASSCRPTLASHRVDSLVRSIPRPRIPPGRSWRPTGIRH